MEETEELIQKIYKLLSHNDATAQKLLAQTKFVPFAREHRFIFTLAEVQDIPLCDVEYIIRTAPKLAHLNFNSLSEMIRPLDARSLMARLLLFSFGKMREWALVTIYSRVNYTIFLNMATTCYRAMTQVSELQQNNQLVRKSQSSVSSLVSRPWEATWYPERFRPPEPKMFHEFKKISDVKLENNRKAALNFSMRTLY